ncbi:Retrovirus-related Pol polyprotein from transposon [Dictyocoela muelleri]|nr:Retrovirus-related Pol polyprotein from transposon [Dictyocoela muelleri]
MLLPIKIFKSEGGSLTRWRTKIFDKEIKTKRDIQRLIGILNWYRIFIPNLSNRISKITDMLKIENKKFKWTDDMKNITLKIKEEIKNKSTLIFSNYIKKFIIQCDESDHGIGAILMQEDGIISHYSRKFKNSEKN